MIAEDGKDRFYAEVNPLPTEPTDFVRYVVYPLLEHGYCVMQKVDFTQALRTFLARFEDPVVLYDPPGDGKLLCYALCGFGLQNAEIFPRIDRILVSRDDIALLIEQYFRQHPDAAGRGSSALGMRDGFARLQSVPLDVLLRSFVLRPPIERNTQPLVDHQPCPPLTGGNWATRRLLRSAAPDREQPGIAVTDA